MTTVFIIYFDKQLNESCTVRMIETEDLFKYSFEDVTILYDNRTPKSNYQWGYQIANRARHFFESFEKMTEIANDWSERMKLGFKLRNYGII